MNPAQNPGKVLSQEIKSVTVDNSIVFIEATTYSNIPYPVTRTVSKQIYSTVITQKQAQIDALTASIASIQALSDQCVS